MQRIALTNSATDYGLVAIVIHWLMAVVIIGLFALGLWMVELDYYSEWYNTGPDIHRGLGILLLFMLLFRFALRFVSPPPGPEPGIKRWEHLSAVAMHWLLYLAILLVITTGYLISTADGSPIAVFDWFEVPATITSIEDQEDLAGELHFYLAWTLVVLSGVHALAALKHHFVDQDATLKKMLGIARQR